MASNPPIPTAIQAMIDNQKPISTDVFVSLSPSAPTVTALNEKKLLDLDAESKKNLQRSIELVNLPPLSGECKIKSDKQVRDARFAGGSTLAKRIRKITNEINSSNDCDVLQQKLEKALNDIGDELNSLSKPIKKKLEELLPLLGVPLNPFKLPKFIVKQTIGRILPDIEALIDLINRIVEVTKALNDLLIAAEAAQDRLNYCATSIRSNLQTSAADAIEQAALDLERKIGKAIADNICESLNDAGITIEDLDDALRAVNTIQDAISIGEAVMDGSMDNIRQTLLVIDSNQSTMQTLTGIPPVLDTSSITNFITSVGSTDYIQYKEDVNQIMNLPEPVNVNLPVITGSAVVGNTLVCSDGTWSANGVSNNAAFTYSYQWARNGTDIYGANTSTYVPVLDDLDCNLFCTVTAENQTSIEQAQSASVGPVAFGLSPANMPTISGLAKNGQTLTCSTGNWPSEVMTIQYEWVRFESGTVVQPLSSNNQYKATGADIGSSLICKVYAQTSKYLLKVTTSNTSIVIA